MVEETVEHGGGDSAITVEDGRPLFEGFVGGKYDRTGSVQLTASTRTDRDLREDWDGRRSHRQERARTTQR